jgi:thiol-disulfide isomerase/thioredoxin
VLLNFWASWCGPRRREMPGLVRIHHEYKSKGLVVFGVNDEGRGTAREFAEANGLSFDTLDGGN